MLTLESLFAAIPTEEGLRPFQLKVFNMGKTATVTGIAYDSRKVSAGNVFVCVKGEHADGHDYIGQAVKAKACCIVVEDIHKVPTGLLDSFPVVIAPQSNKALALLANKYYAQPAQNLLMVGVTGTNGKTTVTHLLQSILQDAQLPQAIKGVKENTALNTALLGTLGFKGNQQPDYTKTGNTTPMAVEFQQILSHAKQEGFNTVVMEVSSHALDQDRVLGCEFDLAVITNLTQDHLDYHKTMQDYFKAKALLFTSLKPTPTQPKWAVLNLDDEFAAQFISVCPTNVNVITYSLNNPEATISAENVSYSVQGATLTIKTPQGPLPLTLNIAGQFGVYNALAAFASAYALGMNPKDIAEKLKEIKGVAGRFEVINQSPAVIIDYAHTPDGLENVLNAAKVVLPKPDSKLIVVFGCGGDRDATKRPKMGAIADQLAHVVVITSDNPRSEDPQQIISDIVTGIPRYDANRMSVEPDRRAAILQALKLAKPQDIVVIAGKGHEDYQILKDQTIHFDDKEEALAALKQLGVTAGR